MTQRERKLTIVAGGIFAVLMVYLAAQRMIFSPISDLKGRITSAERRRADLQIQLQARDKHRRTWQEFRARTFGTESNVAAAKMDERIMQLLVDSYMVGFRVSPGEPRPLNRDKTAWVLPYTVVTAEASLQNFIGFLHRFYRQPYAMQVVSFNLEPMTMRRNTTGLHISSLVLETIVLSPTGLPPSLVQPANAKAPLPEVAPWRPKDSDLAAYTLLWERSFMQPYTAPPPPPTSTAPPSTPVVQMPVISPPSTAFTGPLEVRLSCATPGATIRYTTDGSDPSPTNGQIARAGRAIRLENPSTLKAMAHKDKMTPSAVAVATYNEPPPPPLTLVGFATYGPIREAILLNQQTQGTERVQEGESLDGGHLVLVLDGQGVAVVEMPDGPRYVYRLGKSLAEKEILDPSRQPDIAGTVEVLLESP